MSHPSNYDPSSQLIPQSLNVKSLSSHDRHNQLTNSNQPDVALSLSSEYVAVPQPTPSLPPSYSLQPCHSNSQYDMTQTKNHRDNNNQSCSDTTQNGSDDNYLRQAYLKSKKFVVRRRSSFPQVHDDQLDDHSDPSYYHSSSNIDKPPSALGWPPPPLSYGERAAADVTYTSSYNAHPFIMSHANNDQFNNRQQINIPVKRSTHAESSSQSTPTAKYIDNHQYARQQRFKSRNSSSLPVSASYEHRPASYLKYADPNNYSARMFFSDPKRFANSPVNHQKVVPASHPSVTNSNNNRNQEQQILFPSFFPSHNL